LPWWFRRAPKDGSETAETGCMALHPFPASVASSLVEGYCADFIQLSASLAQTLEQMSVRDIDIEASRGSLKIMERGMRELADAIGEMLVKAPILSVAEEARAKVRKVKLAESVPEAADLDGLAEPIVPVEHPETGLAGATVETSEPAAPAPAPKPARNPDQHWDQRIDGKAPAMVGTAASMPLSSVFQFLGRMQKTGILTVLMPEETMTFELVDGYVEFTTTDSPRTEERLGELLTAMGFAWADHVEELARKQSGNRRLGSVLAGEQIVSNGQLAEALERQVHLRFQRALNCTEASYTFHEVPRPVNDGRIRLRPSELLFETRGPHTAQQPA